MKITFLGTNGWYTTPTGNTPSVLIDAKEGYVVFDAGNGIYKLADYIKEDKPVSLFISHFHLDHVSGLHSSVMNVNMNVYMGPNRKKDYDILMNPPFSNPKPWQVKELNLGINDVGFPVEVFEMHHAYTDHGFRVTLEGKTISYSGDTGICDNSIPLAKDCDLLIHECSGLDKGDPEWGHVNATEAAQLAKDTNVKKLVLNHFDASVYTDLEKRKIAENMAQEIFPESQIATDNLTITL